MMLKRLWHYLFGRRRSTALQRLLGIQQRMAGTTEQEIADALNTTTTYQSFGSYTFNYGADSDG